MSVLVLGVNSVTTLTAHPLWSLIPYTVTFFSAALLFLLSMHPTRGQVRLALLCCTVSMLASGVVGVLASAIAFQVVTYEQVASLQAVCLLVAYVVGLVAFAVYLPRYALRLGSTWHVMINSAVVGVATFVIIRSLIPVLIAATPLAHLPPLDPAAQAEQQGMHLFIAFDVSLLFALFLVWVRFGQYRTPLIIMVLLALLTLTLADILYLAFILVGQRDVALQATIPLYMLRSIIWGLGAYWQFAQPTVARPASALPSTMTYLEWFGWTRLSPIYSVFAWLCAVIWGPADLVLLSVLAALLLIREFATHQEHQLLQQLQQAKHEREQWLDVRTREVVSIAHDLGQYIQHLAMTIHWFQRAATAPTVDRTHAATYLRRANSALHNQRRLIENMQDAARLQGPGLPQYPQAVDLATLIIPVVRHFQDMLELDERPCSLTYAIPPQLPAGWGDPDILWRVLSNILDNAIKYTREVRHADGAVHLWVHTEATHILISVRDNGKGIADAELHRLGQRWERIAVHDHSSGLGLGLSFCWAVLVNGGGDLAVQSQVGHGTTVTIRLPLAPTSALIRDRKADAPWPRVHGPILLVEDAVIGDDLAAILRSTLTEDVDVVRSVADAQAWLHGHTTTPPQLVLIDYELVGEQTGTHLAQWMQQQPTLATTLRISWSAMPRDRMHAPPSTTDLYHGYIMKTAPLPMVLQRLVQLTQQYHQKETP